MTKIIIIMMKMTMTHLVCILSGFCWGWSDSQDGHLPPFQRLPVGYANDDNADIKDPVVKLALMNIVIWSSKSWPQAPPSANPKLGDHCAPPFASTPWKQPILNRPTVKVLYLVVRNSFVFCCCYHLLLNCFACSHSFTSLRNHLRFYQDFCNLKSYY